MSANEEFTDELKERIVKQVEYYFSDENLIRGKFLRKKIQESDGGWIHVNLLATFEKLANLNTTTKRIGKAIFQSKSKKIEITKDLQRVRRMGNKPLLDKKSDVHKLISRSAYVEGFSKSLQLDDLLKFFEPYSASHIIIRKYFDRATKTYQSKGSAFVTFATHDLCNVFLGEKVNINGVQLSTMHQEIFIQLKHAKKVEERKLKRHKND